MTTVSTPNRAPGGSRALAIVRSVPLPIVLLGGLVLARMALAGWWLTVDEGVMDTESGRHLQMTWNAYAAIDGGDLLVLFGDATEYPPLHHLVGLLGAAIGGLSVDSMVGAQDLLFIPALALGCYGAGSVVYGRTAGLLAALFALATPMTVSVFHMFLIDTPEAAMAALAVWAILASDRFSRTGVAALAGAAVGLGMLAKQNFPIFIGGLLLVVLARGGWRHWRGLVVFAAVAALISISWYWSEVGRTLDLIRGASAAPGAPSDATAATQPARWGFNNLAWYAWSMLNVSVLVPLALMTGAGSLALLARWTRTRARNDYTPELVAGGLVSFAALTWISLKDPRYALPAVVYLAVLGTGWIPLLRQRWRTVVIAALCMIAALNVVGTVADSGPQVRILLPSGNETTNAKHALGLYSPGGWIAGRPETEGAALDVMRRAKADGIEGIAFDPNAIESDFNQPGLDIVSREAGLPLAFPLDEANPRQMMMLSRTPPPRDPRPCAVTSSGMGIYLASGPVAVPFEQRRFYCPPR